MSNSNEGVGRFSVTLPKPVIKQFDAIAAERGTKRAIIMREAALFWLADQQLQQQRRAS